MKKLAVILIMLLYGFTSTGMTLQLHYCCGKLKSVELFATEKKDCGMSHKMGSKPCCETKAFAGSQKSDQLLQVQAINLMVAPADIPAPVAHTAEIILPETISYVASDTSPPQASTPIFIRNCVFRI